MLVIILELVKTLLAAVILYFFFFAFGPKSGPRGSFGTKKSAIDAENARESENTSKKQKKKY